MKDERPAGELLDLVDEDGRVVGQATRARCHADPSLLHQAVHVMVFNGRGELFLQLRSRSKDIQPGKWDSSVGGHVDVGEAPATAARREMAEEIGIESGTLNFLYQYIWRTPLESELVSTYRCQSEGPFSLQSTEIDDGRFFNLSEVCALVGTGQLTPNLEHELERLGVSLPLPPRKR